MAKEMTQDLQDLKQVVMENPDLVVDLVTKGVSFGTIVYEGGSVNLENVEGIDGDPLSVPSVAKANSPPRAASPLPPFPIKTETIY